MDNNNGNPPEFYVNFEAMIAEIKNQAVNKMVVNTISDKEDATMIYKILRAFNKRGISSEVVMEALMEANTED